MNQVIREHWRLMLSFIAGVFGPTCAAIAAMNVDTLVAFFTVKHVALAGVALFGAIGGWLYDSAKKPELIEGIAVPGRLEVTQQ